MMDITTAELFGMQLIGPLKEKGFKKRKLTWYRNDNEVTIVLYIQKSQWGKEVWYYDFGIGINCLHEKQITSREKCEIGERFDQTLRHGILSPCLRELIASKFGEKYDKKILTPKDVLDILDLWIKKYGSIESIKMAFEGDQLPYQTNRIALSKLFTDVL